MSNHLATLISFSRWLVIVCQLLSLCVWSFGRCSNEQMTTSNDQFVSQETSLSRSFELQAQTRVAINCVLGNLVVAKSISVIARERESLQTIPMDHIRSCLRPGSESATVQRSAIMNQNNWLTTNRRLGVIYLKFHSIDSHWIPFFKQSLHVYVIFAFNTQVSSQDDLGRNHLKG